MKIINLVIGAALTWFGGKNLYSENPEFMGWILLVIGIITILSAFSFSKISGSGSSGSSGSGWGDSSGGGSDGGD